MNDPLNYVLEANGGLGRWPAGWLRSRRSPLPRGSSRLDPEHRMTVPGTECLAHERIHPGLPAHLRNHGRALLAVDFDRCERLGREDLIAFLLTEHLAAAAHVIKTASDAQPSPAERLRSAVAALVGFLGERPGVCAGLLSFAGAAGRMASVLGAKDSVVAEPIRRILADGLFEVDDARDATSAMLGAAMIATVDRWYRGDGMTPAFQQRLTEQIVRGVLRD